MSEAAGKRYGMKTDVVSYPEVVHEVGASEAQGCHHFGMTPLGTQYPVHCTRAPEFDRSKRRVLRRPYPGGRQSQSGGPGASGCGAAVYRLHDRRWRVGLRSW